MAQAKFRSAPLFAALVAAVALTACGGSGDGDDSSTAAGTSGGSGQQGGGNHGAGGGQGSLDGNGITAFLNGVEKKATVDVDGFVILNGGAGNSLTAKGSDTPPIVWSIQHLKGAVGEYTCKSKTDGAAIAFTDPSVVAGDPMLAATNAWKIQSTTAPEGGDCKISVTSLDNNVIKGTFSATLIALGTGNLKETYVFENGSFSVPFTSSAK